MKLTQYLKEVRTELIHVSWPTRNQTLLFSALVVGLSAVTAAYLGFWDFIFKLGVERILPF